ncbi:MAG: GNAT family N-acetyltransferase, partial [Gaiellaceae bacterium]
MSGLAEVAAPDWDELLERLGCADVYLLAEYVESASLLEPGRPAFLHLAEGGGDVVFPFLLRDLPAGSGHDVVTPYGYGGPVAVGLEPPAARFWELYEDWCRANGVVTSFVRFHPLFANHRYAGASVRLEPLAGTVGWRLDLPDLFAAMDGSHRNVCRKAERAGVAVSVEEGPADISAFTALYEETMERVDADGFYRFPASYWDALVAGLGEWLAVFHAAESGEVVASALCFATPPWLHYHLAATSERGRALGASNLLLFEAARWG